MPISSSRTFVLVATLEVVTSGCWHAHRYNRYAHRYGGDVPFTLVNDSPVSVCYVRMSPSTDRNWGDDWLGPREIIPSGAARTFAVEAVPAWDIQLQTCDHQVLAEARQFPMTGAAQVSVTQLRGQVPVQAVPQQPVYVQPMQKPSLASSGS